MKFPIISKEEMIKRLASPKGKVRMVLDTDTYNEVDDQFALAYALLSPERLNVEAVYTAPFSATFFEKYLDKVQIPMTKDLKQGLELSYNEILNIYNLVGKDPAGRVFKGSERYLTEVGKPVESEAAKDLVARAMASDELLYVVAIGDITNVASAILMEPEIINKIVVVWLGGQPLYWPQTIEFNMGQDIIASQLMFDCGVPLVVIPCMGVASHLTTTAGELNENLNGKSRIGSFLSELVISQLSQEAAINMLGLIRSSYLIGVDDYEQDVVNDFSTKKMACSRIIWDISTIGYMINPNWCPTTLTPAPNLLPDMTWKIDPSRHLMRYCNYIYRDCVYGDMFKKLAEAD